MFRYFFETVISIVNKLQLFVGVGTSIIINDTFFMLQVSNFASLLKTARGLLKNILHTKTSWLKWFAPIRMNHVIVEIAFHAQKPL